MNGDARSSLFSAAPIVILEFNGLAPDETLVALGTHGIQRIDPLEFDPDDVDAVAAFVEACAANLTDGSRLVAYCAGAALAISIANSAWRNWRCRTELVLIDPTRVDVQLVSAAVQKFWFKYVDRETSQRDLAEIVAMPPAKAAALTHLRLEGRIRAQLSALGLDAVDAQVAAGDLSRRYQQWVWFLQWSRISGEKLDKDLTLTVVSIDPSRLTLDVGHAAQQELVAPYDAATYLAYEGTLEVIRRALGLEDREPT